MVFGPSPKQIKVFDEVAKIYDEIAHIARSKKSGVSRIRICGMNGGTSIRRIFDAVGRNLADGYTVEILAWDTQVHRLKAGQAEPTRTVYNEIKRLERVLESSGSYNPALDYESLASLACEYLMLGSKVLLTPGRQGQLIRQIEGVLSNALVASEIDARRGAITTRLAPFYIPAVIIIVDEHIFVRLLTYSSAQYVALQTTQKNPLYQLLDDHFSAVWAQATAMGAPPLGRDADAELAHWQALEEAPDPLPSARIFMNYRRSDSGWAASRLYDELITVFGVSNVFLDHKAIANSVRFKDEIRHHIEACEVFLVCIGPDWTTVEDAEGQQRLADPDDLVRLEIEMALQLEKTILIIKVDDAGIPNPSDLPESLRVLCGIHSDLPLKFSTFRQDAQKIATTITALAG